ncbi:hypothetical protein [Paracidovorax wautersii]
MKYQIVQWSTGKELSDVFGDFERIGLLMELVARLTGIDFDDLECAWIPD